MLPAVVISYYTLIMAAAVLYSRITIMIKLSLTDKMRESCTAPVFMLKWSMLNKGKTGRKMG